MVACQTVIFFEVNYARRNSTEAGTCCVFANASVYFPASIQGTLLVPLICHPHWALLRAQLPYRHIFLNLCASAHRLPLGSFRVMRGQISIWTFDVLTPNSTDFCWLMQSWLQACRLPVQIVAAAQENYLKSPGDFGKNANSNYSLKWV